MFLCHYKIVSKILFIISFFIIAFANYFYGAEFLINGSIEKYQGYDYPLGWDYRKNNCSLVNTNPVYSYSGKNSLKIDLSMGNEPEWDHEVFPIKSGEQYQVRLWYKVDVPFSSGEIFIVARWWQNSSRTDWAGQVQLASGIGLVTTVGWVEVNQTIQAPINANYGEVIIWSNAGTQGPNGLAFFDDFSFCDIPSVSPPGENPNPLDGQMDANIYTVLSWNQAGDNATYNIFLGNDYISVLDANTFSPEFLDTIIFRNNPVHYAITLNPYKQYFWRVDGMNSGGVITKGDVWSFYTWFDSAEKIGNATARRYDAKDNQGRGLDGIKIIENPVAPGYMGVHHSYISGEFEMRLVTSINLINWTHITTLEQNADMPTIAYHPSTGGFFVAHEQWGSPGSTGDSNLRFRYYPSYSDLVSGNDTKDFLAPFSPFNSSHLEGTPNFFSISSDGNQIEVGFHYFKTPDNVDRIAFGTLTNFIAGSPTWTTQAAADFNNKLFAKGLNGNFGDRDYGTIFGSQYMLQEGQYIQYDFGSWRAWFYDYSRNDYFPLFPVTNNGSKNFGNMTFGFLTSPNGKPAVVGSYFIFSEQAGIGEAGEAIFYNEFEMKAQEPFPGNTDINISKNVQLCWLSGAGANNHNVYFGDSEVSVTNATTSSPEYLGRVAKPHYNLSGLQSNKTYYWRIDEITPDEMISKGDVWSFTTIEQSLIERWDLYN